MRFVSIRECKGYKNFHAWSVSIPKYKIFFTEKYKNFFQGKFYAWCWKLAQVALVPATSELCIYEKYENFIADLMNTLQFKQIISL